MPAGGLPGPQFQALPQPAPLPRLPRPAHQLEADMAGPSMAPMTAPGGEPQPGAQYQVTICTDSFCQYMWQQNGLSIVSSTVTSLAQCHESRAGREGCELCAQSKPTKNAYFGLGRRLQQGPEDGPPGTIPEADAYAAETPQSAPGKTLLPRNLSVNSPPAMQSRVARILLLIV